MKLRFLALAFALIIAPQTVWAADPVITKLSRNKAAPESVVEIIGRNFGKDAKKVRVEVGGKACLVTEVMPTQITVLTARESKMGANTLTVIINGRSAKIQIEIVKFEDLNEGDNDGGTEDTAVAGQQTKLIIIEALEEKAVGGKVALHVRGRTENMVDGFKISLEVRFGKRSICKSNAVVKKNQISHTFRALPRRLYPGTYGVETIFLFARQRSRLRREWKKKYPAADAKKYKEVTRADFFDVGSTSAAEETAKLKKNYEGQLVKFHKIFEEMQTAYAATSRCMFRKGRKINEENWSNWLFEQKFVKDTGEFDKLKKMKRYTRGVYLNDDAWKAFLSQQSEKIMAQYKVVLDISKRYMTPRFPKTDESLMAIASTLVDMSLRRTRSLYERSDLKYPDSMRKDIGVASLPSADKNTVGYYLMLRKRCDQELNPTKIEGEEKSDAPK